MSLRHVIVTTTAVYAVFGLAFALFGPLMIQLYGYPSPSGLNSEPAAVGGICSFARLFGISLIGLAVIVWSLRATETSAQRKLIASLGIANLALAAFSFGQWHSVWGTSFGIVTVFVFGALAIMALIQVAESHRLSGID